MTKTKTIKSRKVEKQTKTKTKISPCKYKLNNSDIKHIGIFSCSKIVYDNGNISAKNYNSTSDTMYQIASCSKFITAIVVAKLYELGKLDYDTDINKYLKKWKCPKKGITLKHLLTHTSGSSDHNGYSGIPPQYPLTQDFFHHQQLLQNLKTLSEHEVPLIISFEYIQYRQFLISLLLPVM